MHRELQVMFSPLCSHLEGSALLIVFDEVVSAEQGGCGMNEVSPSLLQERVYAQFLVADPVELGSTEHANVEVGIT